MASSAHAAGWDAAGTAASWLAVLVAVGVGFVVFRQVRLMRDQNAMQVLVELFGKHQAQLADARAYVFKEVRAIPHSDLRERGIEAIHPDWRKEVTYLAWFYDHVGSLVAHGVIDLEPISGYMGDSVIRYWRILEPVIEVERQRRSDGVDDQRWQRYFENLYHLVLACPPAQARGRQRNWKLSEASGRNRRAWAAWLGRWRS